jgi:hypothetical protein
VLAAGLAPFPANGSAQNVDLSKIIERYGGAEKLSQARRLYVQGTTCVKGRATANYGRRPCRDFKVYRMGSLGSREEADVGQVTAVRIVRQNEGFQYFRGWWPVRAFLNWGGLRDGPMSPVELAAAHRWSELPVTSFLYASQFRAPARGEREMTLDGKPAEVFLLTTGNLVAQYFFDPQTLLCLQSTVTGTNNRASLLYQDYRDVNGLPYPFRIQQFDGNSLTEVETVDSVQIGIALNSRILSVPISQPLWVLPTALFVGILVGVVTMIVIKRKRVGQAIGGSRFVSTA